MARKQGLYDLAIRDFLPFAHMHKVEREKDRPWVSDTCLAFLGKKGLVKDEGGKQLITVGDGWAVGGRVGTRAGRYIVPANEPAAEAGK